MKSKTNFVTRLFTCVLSFVVAMTLCVPMTTEKVSAKDRIEVKDGMNKSNAVYVEFPEDTANSTAEYKQYNMILHNNTSSAISSWEIKVEFASDPGFNTGWNGASCSGNTITIQTHTDTTWNNVNVQAGETASGAGFQLRKGDFSTALVTISYIEGETVSEGSGDSDQTTEITSDWTVEDESVVLGVTSEDKYDTFTEYFFTLKNLSSQSKGNWTLEITFDKVREKNWWTDNYNISLSSDGKTLVVKGNALAANANLSGIQAQLKPIKANITKVTFNNKAIGIADFSYKCNYPVTGDESKYECKYTPYQMHGKLTLKGTDIVDQSGKKVQLRGVSTHGIQYDSGNYAKFVNEKAMKQLRDEFGVNLIRIAAYTETDGGSAGYCTGNSAMMDTTIQNAVTYANKLGMYVLIDWHILQDGNPNHRVNEAKSFFEKYSKMYAKDDHVIYEICNEPQVGWSEIKTYADTIIPIIRKNDADGLICVGTPNYSGQPDEVIGKEVANPHNVLYSVHFYAGSTYHMDSMRSRVTKAHNAGIPIFGTEYGLTSETGDSNIEVGLEDVKKWMAQFEEYNISMALWNLSNDGQMSAMFNKAKYNSWTTDDLKTTGVWCVNTYKDKAKKELNDYLLSKGEDPVVETIHVSSVSVTPTSVTLEPGETKTLKATVMPATATDASVTYSSLDSSIATVSSTGVITAVKPGTVTVKVTSVDNSKATATCKVTVSKPSQEAPEISSKAFAVTSDSLKANVVVSNGVGKTLEYSIDDGVTWQTTGSFTKLSGFTNYLVYIRFAETSTNQASAKALVGNATTYVVNPFSINVAKLAEEGYVDALKDATGSTVEYDAKKKELNLIRADLSKNIIYTITGTNKDVIVKTDNDNVKVILNQATIKALDLSETKKAVVSATGNNKVVESIVGPTVETGQLELSGNGKLQVSNVISKGTITITNVNLEVIPTTENTNAIEADQVNVKDATVQITLGDKENVVGIKADSIVVSGGSQVGADQTDKIFSVEPVDENGDNLHFYTITYVYSASRTESARANGDCVTLPIIDEEEGYRLSWVDESGKEYAQGATVSINSDLTFTVKRVKVEVTTQKPQATTQKPQITTEKPTSSTQGNKTTQGNGTTTTKDSTTTKGNATTQKKPSLVTSILLCAPTKKVAPGKKLAINLIKNSSEGKLTNISFKVSKTKYAKVSSKGIVTTKKKGAGKKVQVTVTATNEKGYKLTATYKISIMKKAVSKIKLNYKTKVLKKGKTFKVKTKCTPKKGISKEVTYESSKPTVVFVDAKGRVKALKKGKAKITVRALDGSKKKASITVKVK